MKTKFMMASVLMVFGGAVAAHAGLVDVAFYSSNFTTASATGAAVLGQTGDQWNSIDAGDPGSYTTYGPYALSDTAGNPSGVTLGFMADGGVVSLALGTQPDPNLTNSYLFGTGGDAITATLTGLVPDQNYQLVLYVASNDAAGGDRSLMGTVDGLTSVPFSATGNPESMFINGENIVELSVAADATGTIAITESDGPNNSSGEVDMNGLQLQNIQAPEPASFVLLCLGGVALWLGRRRLCAVQPRDR